MATSIELSAHELQGLCRRYLHQSDDAHTHNRTNSDIQVLSYKLKPVADTVTGFLGRHQFLCVEVRLSDDAGHERTEKLRFFTKSAPVDMASRMEYLEEFGVFRKEIRVYSEVLPQLQKYCPDVAPKCYYADNNLLVFENLVEQAYKMAAGRDGLLNYEHLHCVVKTLAAMHAGSIVYEGRCGRSMNELHPEAVVENSYPRNLPAENKRMQNFNNANRVFREMLKELPKYRQSDLDFILEEFPKKMATIFELVQVSGKYQNTFSHGDLWANNIMFQYGKFGESPIQCRFVDFQLSRYAPPMVDLMTVLTIPTDRRFRAQYLSELLCDYYRFTSEFLKRENLHIEDYIPKQQFFESANEFRIVGLIESLLFSHMTILPPAMTESLTGSTDGFNDFFDRKRVEICLAAFHTDELYRERLTDMLEDFVDNFVLKQRPN